MRRCNTGRGRCTADGHAHDYHRHLRAKAGAPGPPTDQPARGAPPSRDGQGAGQRQPPTAAARPGPRRGAVRHRPRRPGGYARPGGLQPAHSRFRVAEGCLDCAGDLEGALSHLAGVQAVEVLSAAGIVTISHDGRLDPAAVSEQAGRLRVRLAPADTPAARAAAAPGRGWWRTPRLLALAAAELLLLAGLAVDRLAHQHTLGTTLYLATVAVGGVFPFRTAIDVLRRRRLTIGALLVIATAGALALGVVSEAAMLVVVFSLGGVL